MSFQTFHHQSQETVSSEISLPSLQYICAARSAANRLVDFLQVSSVTSSSCAVVWHLGSCEELERIVHPTDSRGVYACAFSGDGKLLVTVCGDNHNTVRVFEWACQRLVANGIGHNGVPPQVFGVTFDPFQASRLRSAFPHRLYFNMKHSSLQAVLLLGKSFVMVLLRH